MDTPYLTLDKTDLLSTDEQSSLERLQEHVLNPALNASVIEPWNAAASTLNSVSRLIGNCEILERKAEYKVAPSQFLSSSWLVQGVAGGLAMLAPYTVAGKLAGAVMRTAGERVFAAELAPYFQNRAAAQIAGAAAYDGMREAKHGETRIGNALGGAAAFTAFEIGNYYSRGAGVAPMLAARAFTGALGAGAQTTVSTLWSEAALPEPEKLGKAMIGGMVMNMVLPEAQRGLTSLVDAGRMGLGIGVPVDRYMESQFRSSAPPPTLLEAQMANPWAKVQTAARSNDFQSRKVLLSSTAAGPEKLGRELVRMTEVKGDEAGFRAVDGLLKQNRVEDAWLNYRELRLNQEARSLNAENRISNELGKARSVFSAHEFAQEVAAWPAPAGLSQERRWRQEFTLFQESGGRYRPGHRFVAAEEYQPAEKAVRASLDFDPATLHERRIAEDVVRLLQKKGHIAVFAGGSVRDELMGRIPKDFDIASSATPEAMERIFTEQGFKVLSVGKQFGTVKAIVDGVQVEVTTLRNDGNYTDGRRPDSVQFASTLREDAARRDLTMNAIFKDPLTGNYYDLFNGKADIDAGLIKTVGDPRQRFSEDALRMMRVPRFAARYGFSVEPGTLAAIKTEAGNISKVSSERIREELRGVLSSEKPSRGLQLMMDTGLMKEVIPELIPMAGPKGAQDPHWHPEGNAWEHTKMVVDQLALNGNGGNLPLMLAGLLHDNAKPQTQVLRPNGRISNPLHDLIGAPIAQSIAQRLKMSRAESALVEKLVAQHMAMHHVKEMRPGKLANLLRQPEINDLIELQNADARGRATVDAANESNRDWLKSKLVELEHNQDAALRLDAKPLVDGRMINELSFPKTSIRSEILAAARIAQQEGVFKTAEEGRIWVLENYGNERQGQN